MSSHHAGESDEFLQSERQARLRTFLSSMDPSNGPFADRIRREAEEEGVPIIRQDMESFLRVLLTLKKPSRVLEIGSAVGYSAILMALYTQNIGTVITTIEKDPGRAAAARENFRAALAEGMTAGGTEENTGLLSGFGTVSFGRISLIEADASVVLRAMAEEGLRYDFIFMDAAKGQYIHFLPDISTILTDGGVLISDNVLQDMTVLDSRYALGRRDRTIHQRMREYLWVLKHTENLVTSIVPAGDGAAVTVKEEKHA